MQKNENANELLTKRVKISYSAGFFSTCKKSSMHKNNKIEFFYEIYQKMKNTPVFFFLQKSGRGGHFFIYQKVDFCLTFTKS
jgi:hypothetical protein